MDFRTELLNAIGMADESARNIRIRYLLEHLPQKDMDFLQDAKRMYEKHPEHSKVESVKRIRAHYDVGLHAGVHLMNAIADGASMVVAEEEIVICRNAVTDLIEGMVDSARKGVRMTVDSDEKTSTAFMGILTQLQDLWASLALRK